MSPPLKVLISIINYRTSELTITAAQSVLADLDGVAGHIVIVDNASGDGSAEQIADWIAAEAADAPVTLLRSPDNTGFSGGHNLGIAAYEATYYLVLNSDAVLRPGFLRSILAAADAQPEIGLFAPRIEYDDGEIQHSTFRFPSPASELIRGAQTGPVTRLFKRYEVALEPGTSAAEIGWASFACILLRGTMVGQIGRMDEGYFLYFEDAEYCLRARRAGWRIACVPEARAVHFRGGSGPVKALQKDRKRMPGYFYASRTRFFYQAHGWVGLMAANLLWYLGRAVAGARRLAGGSVPPPAVSEARDLWINATNPLGPRLAPHELENAP